MVGWIKLHRELTDKAIWQDSTPEQKVILITLLMMANHQEKEWEWKGKRYKANPGQFVTSLESITNKCGKGVSTQNVRTALNRFEKYEFLTNESTNKNRLVTIVNWDVYQSKDNATNKQANKQLTSNQQATNKQLTTNKNVKNVKNDKEDIYILSDYENKFLNTLEEIENYPLDRKRDLEMFKTLEERYPTLNLVEAIEQWRIYKLDQPLKVKSNPRSQINTAFKKYVDWGKCLKNSNSSNFITDNNPSSWRGSDKRL